MDLLEKRKNKHIVAPGLNWLYGTLYEAEAFGYSNSKAESVGYKKELEVAIRGLREMHKRGITILPGGDYGFAWTPHGTYARDLEVRCLVSTSHTSSLTSAALRQVTGVHTDGSHHLGNSRYVIGLEVDIMAVLTVSGVAKLFMREDELGVVKEGYFADLILVDGNPLEDITVLQEHVRKPLSRHAQACLLTPASLGQARRHNDQWQNPQVEGIFQGNRRTNNGTRARDHANQLYCLQERWQVPHRSS